MIKRILVSVLIFGIPLAVLSQKQSKPTVREGLLYFSLAADKNGKEITIIKDNGRTINKDSLKMADKITAWYKVGQTSTTVKDIAYDNYFLDTTENPTILQDEHGLAFDASIWMSCLDSLPKAGQVVFQVREITLEDGTKIRDPKLAKESKAVIRLHSNPNFPAGGWEAKAKHWIGLWKDWFKLKENDTGFYKLDDKTLELYATGIVYTIK